MKAVIILCVLLTQSLSTVSDSPYPAKEKIYVRQQPEAKCALPKGEWHAANYRGLVMGQATRIDMLRVLGAPQDSGPPGQQATDASDPEEWNEYEGSGELPGKLTVVVNKRSGVILGIDFYPENLSKEEAIKHLGNDYVITRYDFDSCLSKDGGESAPLYESPNGEVEVIEYRKRGIAVGVNYQGRVNQIQYVSKPIGAPSSKCKH
jgi:hypothetical protein